MLSSHGHELGSAAAKSAPPVAVLAANAAGLTLEQWVFIATLVWLVLQSGYLIWKWVRDIGHARKEKRND